MKSKELDYVRGTVEKEGFFSAFRDYSEFLDINDGEFHRLRKNLLNAAKELGEYLNLDSINYQ